VVVSVFIFFVSTRMMGNEKNKGKALEGDAEGAGDDDDDGGRDLDQNMWALILVAAVGRAKFESTGAPISTWVIVLVSIFMGSIQLTALFLMIHDLDPNADPFTVKPSTPFGSPWTVNSMKVIMTIFMVIALVGEAGQCQKVFEIGLAIKEQHFVTSRWVPLGMELFQYVIALCVTWSGVAVILSFQSVPDIIYSSMSIMCISGVDEMFYECFDSVFGLDAKFDIKKDELDQHWLDSVPGWLTALMKFLLAFPMLLGIFCLVRAWHSGCMPTDRVRDLLPHFLS